jgi:diguanylate cyclase (GGDEF)-like protein/PAS domain S-box-containing protein
MTDTRREHRRDHDVELIAAVYDAAPIGVAAWTVDGQLLHANPVLCQLLGRRLDQLRGELFERFIHPDETDAIVGLIADIWAGRRNHFECDLACESPDGRRLWLRSYFAPVYGPAAEPEYVISHVFSFEGHDPYRDHLRRMADHSSAMLWLTDATAVPWLGNRTALEFLGRDEPSGPLGRGWTESLHTDDLEQAQDVIRAAVARREPFEFAARSRRTDGVWRWLQHRARPVFDAAGRFQGYAGASLDVTDREQHHHALGASQRLFEGLAETGPVAVVRTDAEGRVTYFNDRWSELLDDHERQLRDLAWHDIVQADDVERIRELGRASVATGRPFTIRVRAAVTHGRGPEGVEPWGELRGAPEFGPSGEHTGFVATLIDVSNEVAESARADRLARVLDASLDYVLIASPSGAITYLNDAGQRAFGPLILPADREPEPAAAPSDDGTAAALLWDLLPTASQARYRDLIVPALEREGVWRGDLVLRQADGRELPVSAQFLGHREGERVTSISMVARDISEQVAAQDQLRHLATHDKLTGLANRALLYDLLDQALARAQRLGVSVALLYCDLDHFKPVNDEHGHDAGDDVLVEVARRINEVVRETDTAARIGGDEFVVLLEGARDLDLVAGVARRLLESIRRPIELPVATVQVSASIGLVVAPDGCDDADQLMGLADRAMYRAKAEGRDRVELVVPSPG